MCGDNWLNPKCTFAQRNNMDFVHSKSMWAVTVTKNSLHAQACDYSRPT